MSKLHWIYHQLEGDSIRTRCICGWEGHHAASDDHIMKRGNRKARRAHLQPPPPPPTEEDKLREEESLRWIDEYMKT